MNIEMLSLILFFLTVEHFKNQIYQNQIKIIKKLTPKVNKKSSKSISEKTNLFFNTSMPINPIEYNRRWIVPSFSHRSK